MGSEAEHDRDGGQEVRRPVSVVVMGATVPACADAEPRSAGGLWNERPDATLWTVSGRSARPTGVSVSFDTLRPCVRTRR